MGVVTSWEVRVKNRITRAWADDAYQSFGVLLYSKVEDTLRVLALQRPPKPALDRGSAGDRGQRVTGGPRGTWGPRVTGALRVTGSHTLCKCNPARMIHNSRSLRLTVSAKLECCLQLTRATSRKLHVTATSSSRHAMSSSRPAMSSHNGQCNQIVVD